MSETSLSISRVIISEIMSRNNTKIVYTKQMLEEVAERVQELIANGYLPASCEDFTPHLEVISSVVEDICTKSFLPSLPPSHKKLRWEIFDLIEVSDELQKILPIEERYILTPKGAEMVGQFLGDLIVKRDDTFKVCSDDEMCFYVVKENIPQSDIRSCVALKDDMFTTVYECNDKVILMSRTNTTGHKLEELLHQVQIELAHKTSLIVEDQCHASKVIIENNNAIIELLKSAEILQRQSMAELDKLAEDQGPTGTPRIGK